LALVKTGIKPISKMSKYLFSSVNKVYGLVFAASLSLIIIALIFEYVLLLRPCLLCYAQRYSVYMLLIFSLIALSHRNHSLLFFRIYLGVFSFLAMIGASFSIRQLYLQSLPKELVPSCGPDLEYLLDSLPLLDVFFKIIQGDGNCAEVAWSFLGISIPGWVLIALIFLFLYFLCCFYFSNK